MKQACKCSRCTGTCTSCVYREGVCLSMCADCRAHLNAIAQADGDGFAAGAAGPKVAAAEVARLRRLLRSLLCCAELNQDAIEPETAAVVLEARQLVGGGR